MGSGSGALGGRGQNPAPQDLLRGPGCQEGAATRLRRSVDVGRRPGPYYDGRKRRVRGVSGHPG
eukprot:3812959-Lingulodinium_polyedra.AAC.1